jgi:thioredoxin reductase (NADPH)
MYKDVNINKVIIIGGGCAGLTAAIYCGRAELNPLLFADSYDNKGGLLVKTSQVENFPGYPSGINGYDLITNMEEQAIHYNTKIINSRIKQINQINQIDEEFEGKKIFHLIDTENNEYYSETIIICTGSRPNKLGLHDEDKYWTHGISSCAVCDGALYKNKSIVVVGGGDSAMEEALFLTKFSNVLLIHRKKEFRASKIMQNRVLNNPRIKVYYNCIIEKLIGEDQLTSIDCYNTETNNKFNIKVDGLFYGLGLKPNTELFQGLVSIDNDGYIICENDKYETMTSMNGVFCAGDVHDRKYRQAIVAAGDGCKAALDVVQYLSVINS